MDDHGFILCRNGCGRVAYPERVVCAEAMVDPDGNCLLPDRIVCAPFKGNVPRIVLTHAQRRGWFLEESVRAPVIAHAREIMNQWGRPRVHVQGPDEVTLYIVYAGR